MKNIKQIVIIIVIVLIVLLSFYLVFAWGKELWPFEAKYQVVSLTTGEVYYGRLTFSPSPRIIEPWFFQQTSSEEKNKNPKVNLVSFSALFFAPENILYLEKDQIAWWADLKEDSDIVKFIKSQKGNSAKVPPTGEQSP